MSESRVSYYVSLVECAQDVSGSAITAPDASRHLQFVVRILKHAVECTKSFESRYPMKLHLEISQ